MNRQKKNLLILLLIILVMSSIITYAPRFLLYSSGYQKTDAIILFLGPDFTARQREAYKIINESMTDYLIIPAYYRTYKIFTEGKIKYLSPNLSSRSMINKKASDIFLPSFYEDTHKEAIEARKIMSYYGLKSAIFISSPYHMRRIKFIVTNVFAREKENFYFVPTRYEKAPANFWELSSAEWKKVGREYGKIIWFYLYLPWVN